MLGPLPLSQAARPELTPEFKRKAVRSASDQLTALPHTRRARGVKARARDFKLNGFTF